jgi:Uncharacterised nucleotidyltransferase
VNRELAEAIVDCLSLSPKVIDPKLIGKFGVRDWERTFTWLDTAGLTLYLWQQLKRTDTVRLLPPPVVARFERKLADNRRRVDQLADQFDSLNQRFNRAGVNYAVIKGFALVPEFCPDPVLRATSDLDYLVDRSSLATAQGVLQDAGYCLHRSSDIEFKFGRPSSRAPTLFDDPYSRETEALVELHLGLCNWRDNRVLTNEPEFRLDQTIDHDWQGLRFPVLRPEDAFVLQIVHIFQHTLECWAKLCWFLEIGCFMKAYSHDLEFWGRVDARLPMLPCLDEFATVVMGLSQAIFATPLPPVAAKWQEGLRPPAKSWIENYGREWAIEEHPNDALTLFSASKLALFLHQAFLADPKVRREITQRRLFPWKRPDRIAVPAEKTAASLLTARQMQWQYVLRRLSFHLGSSSRYLIEMPRWRKLNRLSDWREGRQPDATPTIHPY